MYSSVSASEILAVDRADFQLAVKEGCRGMPTPGEGTPTYEAACPLPQGCQCGDSRWEQQPRGRQKGCRLRRQRLAWLQHVPAEGC